MFSRPYPRLLVLRLLLVLVLSSGALSAQLVGDRQNGLASAYSPEYDGAETAYGVTYDRNDLVAAHKTYPLNSTVRVTNEANGRSVTVRIIDKGPFIRGRIIELSERAADALDMQGARTVPVELQLLSTPDQPSRNTSPPPARPEPIPEAPVRTSTPAPSVETTPTPETPTPTERTEAPQRPSPSVKRAAPAPRRTFRSGLYRIQISDPEEGRYGVQVGSYRNLESAMDRVVELQGRYFDEVLLQKEKTQPATVYKVILGTFADLDSAQHYAASLKQRYGIEGFTVELPR